MKSGLTKKDKWGEWQKEGDGLCHIGDMKRRGGKTWREKKRNRREERAKSEKEDRWKIMWRGQEKGEEKRRTQ